MIEPTAKLHVLDSVIKLHMPQAQESEIEKELEKANKKQRQY